MATSAQGRLCGRVPSPTMSAARPRTTRTEERPRMYVKVGDIDIFYTTAGVGPTCLVPSLAGTPIYERTFIPALQEVMHLVFVELRGNRTTAGDVDALTFDGMVDDLEGVRREL